MVSADLSGCHRQQSPTAAGPIFIVGCNRSGTTALYYSLAEHSLLRPKPIDHEGHTILEKEHWFLREFFLGREKNQHDVHRGTKLDREFTRRFAQLVDEFSQEKFAGPAGRWISAHPANGFYLGEILELYPRARAIFLLRHPQEVAWSSVHTKQVAEMTRWKFLDRAKLTTRWWRRFAEIAISLKNGEMDPRAILIRHERLIEAPEQVAREILDHLELPFEQAVADQLGKVNNSSFLEAQTSARSVPRSRLALAKDTEFCARVIEMGGDLMDALGFEDHSLQRESPLEPYFQKANGG